MVGRGGVEVVLCYVVVGVVTIWISLIKLIVLCLFPGHPTGMLTTRSHLSEDVKKYPDKFPI